MKTKDSYSPDEIAEMMTVHSYIAEEMSKLKTVMLETKEQLYKTKDKRDVDRAWGHFLGNRYVGVQRKFVEAYQDAIPEDFRKSLRARGMSLDITLT